MASYEVFCPACGPGEVHRPMSARHEPFACPTCGCAAEQRFSPQSAPSARIDDMASVGHDRRDPRTRDVNLGLPPQVTIVGKNPDGSPRREVRPTTNADVSSNRAARTMAREHGLTMDGGRYRSTPK